MDDELLDVVDEYDTVISTINRKDYKQFLSEKRGYIRASELFIMNDEGKLWAPVRVSSKTIAPNGYDFAAAGHVASGEGYRETIIREVKEEINLDIAPGDIEFFAKLKTNSIRYFRSLYLLRTNQTPMLNPTEFAFAEWLTPNELISSIDDGHAAKSVLHDSVTVLKMYLTNVSPN